jgi:hypothetical protein
MKKFKNLQTEEEGFKNLQQIKDAHIYPNLPIEEILSFDFKMERS